MGISRGRRLGVAAFGIESAAVQHNATVGCGRRRWAADVICKGTVRGRVRRTRPALWSHTGTAGTSATCRDAHTPGALRATRHTDGLGRSAHGLQIGRWGRVEGTDRRGIAGQRRPHAQVVGSADAQVAVDGHVLPTCIQGCRRVGRRRHKDQATRVAASTTVGALTSQRTSLRHNVAGARIDALTAHADQRVVGSGGNRRRTTGHAADQQAHNEGRSDAQGGEHARACRRGGRKRSGRHLHGELPAPAARF